MGLPENAVFLFENTSNSGENMGGTTSKSICINEPNYPPVSVETPVLNKSAVVMKVSKNGNQETELAIRNLQFNAIDLPVTAYVKGVKSDILFTHIIFPDLGGLPDYIKQHIYYCVDHYESSEKFGCCGQFIQCSDAMKCVHVNKLYAKGCAYGKNLEKGEIFYGKNANTGLKNRNYEL